MITVDSFPDLCCPTQFDAIANKLACDPRVCLVRDFWSPSQIDVLVEEISTSIWYALTFYPTPNDDGLVLAGLVPWDQGTGIAIAGRPQEAFALWTVWDS